MCSHGSSLPGTKEITKGKKEENLATLIMILLSEDTFANCCENGNKKWVQLSRNNVVFPLSSKTSDQI